MAKKRRRVQQESTISTSNTPLILGIAGVVAVAILGLLIFSVMYSPPEVTPTPIPVIEGVVTAEAPLSRDHDEALEIPFGELPPDGGAHNPIWQNCGIYVDPVLPQHAVHSLEHGAVWVTYQPEMSEDEVATLEDEVTNHSYVILSPYPNQRSPIVMTAWGVQLELDSAVDPRVAEFLDVYEQGPQTPEPGGACVGGVDFTVSSN